MSQELAELAHLATDGFGTHSVDRALKLLKRRLHAREVALVHGDNDTFRQFSTPVDINLSDFALWMINRDLTSRNGPSTFNIRKNHVVDFEGAAAMAERDCIASLVPIPNSSANMLIARGPWTGRMGPASLRFLVAAGPALAVLLERRLDLAFAQKQRDQLNALINIAKVMSASGDLEEVLSSLAVTISTIAEMDYVSIDIVDADGQVELRCVNYETRPENAANDRWKTRREDAGPIWREVLGSRRPMVFADAQSDPRMPADLREFLARSLIRSSAVFPLLTRDRPIGILSVSSNRRTDFNHGQIEMIESLAGQVATAVMGIQLYQDLAASQRALEEKSEQLEHALATEREHARHDALTGVLNHGAVTEELVRLISTDDGRDVAVAMIDVDGMKAVNDTYGHLAGDAVLVGIAKALDTEGAIVGRYGGDEFLVLIPGDKAASEAYREAMLRRLDATQVTDADTGAAIPLVVSVGLAIYPAEAGTIVDLIKLSDSAMYSAKWQRVLTRGDGLSGRGDERTARMVGALVPLLTSPGTVADKLSLVARRLSADGDYDSVDCQLFESQFGPPFAESTVSTEQNDSLRDQWVHEQRRETRQPKLRSILARTRRPMILRDLEGNDRLTTVERQLLREAGLQSAIVAPMFWQDELIGILSVARKQKNAFEPRDAQFLAAVANQVTAIVRMSALVEDLQAASTRLTDAQAETVMMLAAAAEAHDRTTGLHLKSIRAISEALARELGYSERDVRELGLAAALHDIGKISVPDSILSSTRRFDSEDVEVVQMWEVMRQHSVWGAQFLSGRPGFELAASVARSHHERWDGTGYPDGLQGDEIPERVAIVSVADALDAMISDRPYHSGRPSAVAVQEIVRCSGLQFSPRVVAALVRLHDARELPSMGESDRAAA